MSENPIEQASQEQLERSKEEIQKLLHERGVTQETAEDLQRTLAHIKGRLNEDVLNE